jgi:hypothetical protein
MRNLGPELTRLMEPHLPTVSTTNHSFRRAICIKCSRPIETMWHCWHDDGGYLKEQHLCRDCGRDYGLTAPETLVVVAAVDNRFDDNVEKIRERSKAFVRMDTSGGGYPPWAYISAYLQYPEYDSYLFLQDSMEPIADNIVAPFRQENKPVVAWATFPLNEDGRGIWDGDEQFQWVARQYFPHTQSTRDFPRRGIFGPVFYATRAAMDAARPYFPKYPTNRIEYQGTERAWPVAFMLAGVEVGSLGKWEQLGLEQGNPHPPFRKTFAVRA